MGFNQERYFFISGFISLFFFFSLIVIIGYSSKLLSFPEQFALKKSDFISVSIEDIDIPAPVTVEEEHVETQPVETTAPAKEPTLDKPLKETPPQPVSKKETKSESRKTPELSELFAQIKPQNNVEKIIEERKRLEKLSMLENQLALPNEKMHMSEKVKEFNLAKPSLKMVVKSGSSGPTVNEYHAKIHALVYANFHPPVGSSGSAVRVRVSISAVGRMLNYKIIVYSNNEALNTEVDWLKERLQNVVFPKHPDDIDTDIEFILTAKG
ncbi:MAG: TonB C-terminal domain-containing protein [Sulfuricurvum sp.]|nr:TonB C-terminal domain-containing protein [Sulfuricurvum sp.]